MVKKLRHYNFIIEFNDENIDYQTIQNKISLLDGNNDFFKQSIKSFDADINHTDTIKQIIFYTMNDNKIGVNIQHYKIIKIDFQILIQSFNDYLQTNIQITNKNRDCKFWK